MKQDELMKHSVCSLCGWKIMTGSNGLPLFWVVSIERYGLKLDAIRRQDGLTAMLGGQPRLASVMGPNEDMATRLGDPDKLTVCEDCAMEKLIPVACLAQIAAEAAD